MALHIMCMPDFNVASDVTSTLWENKQTVFKYTVFSHIRPHMTYIVLVGR